MNEELPGREKRKVDRSFEIAGYVV